MMDGVHIGTSVWSSDHWGGPFCPNKFTDPRLCRGSVNLTSGTYSGGRSYEPLVQHCPNGNENVLGIVGLVDEFSRSGHLVIESETI